MKFQDIPQFPQAHYNVNISWKSLEDNLKHFSETWIDKSDGTTRGGLNLDPDYQRVHVWTEEQQRNYVEYILQGGEVGRSIIWNCPTWMTSYRHPLELIDGKQRLEAVRKFMRNDLKVFGNFKEEFEDDLHYGIADFVFKICNVKTREEILQLYLNINAGGTPHTAEELERVRKLLKAERRKTK